MADRHPYEDQAVLYLMDRLPADERREFEAQLAESAELRGLLRELVDGSVALAMAVPHRRAPAHIWKDIERVVTAERKREATGPNIWIRWWRYGWAAAAICLTGWLFQALWLSRPSNPTAPSTQAESQSTGATPNEVQRVVTTSQEQYQLPLSKEEPVPAREIAGLRNQIADLSNHITQLSQSVAQQQASLLETNRLKFFQLSSSQDGTPTTNAPVSPVLQQALFLAMARELGWSPGSGIGPAPNGSSPTWQRDSRFSPATNVAGVDFVDLRPGSNVVANSQPQPETPSVNAPDLNLASTASASSVPGFVSGTNAVLAFDSSVAAPGSTLTFWSRGAGQWYQMIGSSVLGNNPMVVTVPFPSMGGGTLTVISANNFGSSNVLGQFPPPNGP
jgi:TolA-binding protein